MTLVVIVLGIIFIAYSFFLIFEAINRLRFLNGARKSMNSVDLYSNGAGAYGVKRWLPGRRYIYNLEAGLEKIEFSEVTEESWTDEWSVD